MQQLIKLLFIIFLPLIGGALLAFGDNQRSGYVLILLGQYSIETNIWILLAAIVIVTALLWLVLGFTNSITATVKSVFIWQRRRQASKQLQWLNESLNALIVDEPQRAIKLLKKIDETSLSPAVNKALQSYVWMRHRDGDKATGALRQFNQLALASPSRVQETLAIESAYINGNYQVVVDIIAPALAHKTVKTTWRLRYLQSVIALKKIDLVAAGLPKKATGGVEFKAVYTKLLQEKTSEADLVWNSMNQSMQADVEVAALYLQRLIDSEAFQQADAFLLAHTQRELFAYVGSYPHINVKSIFDKFNGLLQGDGADSSASEYAALGKVALQQQLWGQAIELLQTSLQQDPRQQDTAWTLLMAYKLSNQPQQIEQLISSSVSNR